MLKMLTTIVIVSAFISCGGGGGGGSSSSSDTSSTVEDVTINGNAILGPVEGATIRAYSINSETGALDTANLLATTTTDSNGEYTLSIPGESIPSNPVGIRMSGGSYVEEATGETVDLTGKNYTTLLPTIDAGDTLNAAVGPLPDMAYQLFASQVQDGLPSGTTINTAVANANYQVSQAFGLSDIVGVLPADTFGSIPNDATGQYALVMAAISKAANNAGTDSTAIAAIYANAFVNGSDLSTVGSAAVTVTNASGQTVSITPPTLSGLNTIVTNIGNGTTQLSGVTPPSSFTAPVFNSSPAQVAPSSYVPGAPSNNTVITPTTYSIGGTVTGLAGTIVLQNNAGDNKTIASNGSYSFTTELSDSAAYSVTILSQPMNSCSITNASGTVNGADVTNVNITCTKYGSVIWLSQVGLETKNNTNGRDPNNQVMAVNGVDICDSIATDSTGNLYCLGRTQGNLNDINGGNEDVFVIKMSASGVVQWVTQLGQNTKDNSNGLDPNNQVIAVDDTDYGWSIAIDATGDIYCGGGTNSSLGDTNGGGEDAFVMKMNSSGVIQWITQLGEQTKDNTNDLNPNGKIIAVNKDESCLAIALDSSGNIYCSGGTQSNLNDVWGGATDDDISNDAFVMKLNSAGVIQWVTHLGQGTRDNSNSLNPNNQIIAVDGNESCADLAVDSSGNIYCAGRTESSLGDANGGGTDSFITKLNSSGVIQWVTQLGTQTKNNSNGRDPNGQVDAVDGNEYLDNIVVDQDSNIYVGGSTTSAFNDTKGSSYGDTLVIKLNSSGAVQWATQFGSTAKDSGVLDPYDQIKAVTGADHAYSIALDSSGKIYVSGYSIYGLLNDQVSFADGAGYVARLTSNGRVDWLTQLGPELASNSNNLDPNGQVDTVSGHSICFDLVVSSSGDVYCAGYTNDNLNGTNGGSVDMFIMKLFNRP